MKKLTAIQIKNIKEFYKSKPITISVNNEDICVSVKKHLSPVDLDNIQNYIDNIVFINDEYCPQYTDIAIRIAWLAVCTDIPLVTSKNKDSGNHTISQINYEVNDMISCFCLEKINQIDSLSDLLGTFNTVKQCAFRHIDYKLHEHYSTLNKQTSELIQRSAEAIDFIDKVSKEMVSVFDNPQLINEIQELSSTTQDLNKRFDMSVSTEFLNRINKE